MATSVSQHVRHIGRHLGFLKHFIFGKTAAIFLKLVENMCLQILSKSYSFLVQT